jgi:hypothetical protein
MLAVAGTVPEPALGVMEGPASLAGGRLRVGGQAVELNRGTAALLAAALQAGELAGGHGVYAFLAGDIGAGRGTRRLYAHLEERLPQGGFSALVFHYLQPDVDWHGRVLLAARAMSPAPLLIADAGFMYAAKMSGQAGEYDLFTPDAGELAFLADHEAPHPFYTRGFILHQDNQVPALISRAYAHGNAARRLLVKGERDYLAQGPGMVEPLDGPSHPALEAIGGTGDTLTGVAGALAAGGMEPGRAARVAALANRLAGVMASPTPATQIAEIIAHLPAALAQALAATPGGKP